VSFDVVQNDASRLYPAEASGEAKKLSMPSSSAAVSSAERPKLSWPEASEVCGLAASALIQA